MLILPTLFLPLDKTGALETHHIQLEPKQAPVSEARLIRCSFGAFFTLDFEIYSVDENQLQTKLIYGEQFRFVEFFSNTTEALGQAVYGGLLVTDPTLPENFLISYRALGGPENADNRAIAEALRNVHGAGYMIDYDQLIDPPATFNPSPHYTDIATLYGLEYLTALFARVTEAIELSPYTQRALVLGHVRDMRLSYQVRLAQFEQTLRDHTRNLLNPHQDTAATIGLEQIRNVGFKPLTVNGVVIEPYVSPSGVKNATNLLVGNNVRLHAMRDDNPHNDSKFTLGLARLENLALHTGYNSGTRGNYDTTYKITVPVYVGAYSARSFVGEYTTTYANVELSSALTSFYEAAQIEIASTQTKLTQYQGHYVGLNVKLQWIQNKAVATTAQSLQTALEEREYRLLHRNSCYAQLLKQIVQHRPTTQYSTQATLVEIPRRIRSLALWLDFSDVGTLVLEHSPNANADRKIKSICDKTNHRRQYSQPTVAAQPIWRASRDALVPNVVGLVKNRVAAFEQGAQHLLQTKGAAFKLKPNSTLLVLSRSGDNDSTLYPLMHASTNSNVNTTDGLYLHGPQMQVAISTQDQSFKLTLPPGSTATNKYTLTVLNLHAAEYGNCWAASTQGAHSVDAPQGLLAGSIMSSDGLVLDQIGINRASANQQGEIAEILYYEEQLSLREVQALERYLSNKWSNVPFTLDTQYVQVAFSAH